TSAAANGGKADRAFQDGGNLPLPGRFYAGRSHESMPLRLLPGSEALHLHSGGYLPLQKKDQPASAGPDRSGGAGASFKIRRTAVRKKKGTGFRGHARGSGSGRKA